MNRIYLLVLCLVLAGCNFSSSGGGGGSSSNGGNEDTGGNENTDGGGNQDATPDPSSVPLLKRSNKIQIKHHFPRTEKWPLPGGKLSATETDSLADSDLPEWTVSGLPENTQVVAINLTQRVRKPFHSNAQGELTLPGLCGDEWALRIAKLDHPPGDQHLSMERYVEEHFTQEAVDEQLRTWPTRYLQFQPDNFPTTACASGLFYADDDKKIPWSAEFSAPDTDDWSIKTDETELALPTDFQLRFYGLDGEAYADCQDECPVFVDLRLEALADTQGNPRNAQDNKRVMTRVTPTGTGRADSVLRRSVKIADAGLEWKTSDSTEDSGGYWGFATGSTNTLGETDLKNLTGRWRLALHPADPSGASVAASGLYQDNGWTPAVVNDDSRAPEGGQLGWLEIHSGTSSSADFQEPLVWFMDQSADGYVAAWDRDAFSEFNIDTSVHLLTHQTPVIYRTLPDGSPNQVSLAPFVPRLALADRRAADRLLYALDFADTELTLTLSRLNDEGEKMGDPLWEKKNLQATGLRFNHARNRLNQSLSEGGVHITDVAQFVFADESDPLLYHEFAQSGRYHLQVSGRLQPLNGPDQVINQSIEFIVADQGITPILSLLPQMPILLQDGGTPLTLQTWPPVPGAQVNIDWKHSQGKPCNKTYSDKETDALGRWQADEILPCTDASADPGEYRLDVSVVHENENALSATSRSWASVVTHPEGQNNSFVVRGKRGFDNMTLNCQYDDGTCAVNDIRLNAPWYRQDAFNGGSYTVEDGHAFNAFHGGDILWIQEDHAAIMNASLRKRPNKKPDWTKKDNCDLPKWQINAIKAQSTKAEVPLLTCLDATEKTKPYNPVSDTLGITTRGYFYSGSERFTSRVRESVGDHRTPGYWRFNDSYGNQRGVGYTGDQVDELKIQYLGAVLENTDTDLKQYAASASGFVLTGPEDWDATQNDSRVRPPLVEDEPLIRLDGEERYTALWPTSLLPGDILQLPKGSDSFKVPFTGQLLPPTNLGLALALTNPAGTRTTPPVGVDRIGVVRSVGPLVFDRPGVWTLEPTVSRSNETLLSDGKNSGESLSVKDFQPVAEEPLLSLKSSYPVFVLPQRDLHNRLVVAAGTDTAGDQVRLDDAFRLSVQLPQGHGLKKLHHVAFMDGWILQQGESTGPDVVFELSELAKIFRTLDVTGDPETSHADLIRITFFAESTGPSGQTHYHHRTVTLNGETLHLDQVSTGL